MKKGFTLSELLIALAILGVIAVFTIPKVLQAQQGSAFKSAVKEVAGTVTQAESAAQLAGTLSQNSTFGDLTPYLNYVKYDTVTVIDDVQTGSNRTCGAGSWVCLRLHNGGIISYHLAQSFAGTGTTNGIYFYFDPDGKETDGTTNGPGKSVNMFLYYNGVIRTKATAQPNTVNSFGTYNPVANLDPPWFSWD